MSTRANIIIKDKYSTLYFYRHSDGYPEGTLPTLNKFLDLIKKNKIYDNVGQCAGWLILIGAIEYQTLNGNLFSESGKSVFEKDQNKIDENLNNFIPNTWKCGSYEPTTGIHGDVDYIYTIDLDTKEIIVEEVEYEEE